MGKVQVKIQGQVADVTFIFKDSEGFHIYTPIANITVDEEHYNKVKEVYEAPEIEETSLGKRIQVREIGVIRKLLERGLSEIESLKDEMCEWRDNMGGSALEQTEKYGRVSEAADTLESQHSDLEEGVNAILALSLPEENMKVTITWIKTRSKHIARHTRLSYSISYIRDSIEELEEALEKKENALKEGEDLPSTYTELRDYIDSTKGSIDELDGVEFPTMFG